MRPTRLAVLVVLLLVPGLLGANGDATTATTAAGLWAAESSASIHPGVRTYTQGAQCTANFVFEQTRTINGNNVREVFLGQAAHCSSKGGSTSTNGCETPTYPPGTPVEIEGASRVGTMVYNSWHTMQAVNERDGNTCAYNDFALVKLHPADHGKVNPTVPHWGGPTGIAATTDFGDQVFSYGRSGLRFGLQSEHRGTSLGTSRDGWTHQVYTVTPGIPGDSGSGFLDRSGRAFGVLSTLQAAPYAGSNGVSDIGRSLRYLRAKTSTWDGLVLARGTRGFDGGLLP